MLSLWTSVALLGLAVRLGEIQIAQGRHYAAAAPGRHRHMDVLPAMRGRIVDRNGQVLALSVQASRIVADPTLIPPDQRATVAAQLGKVLTVSAPQLLQTLQTAKGHYAVLQPVATQAQGDAVRALREPGVSVQPTERREYPDGFFMGGVLGFVNAAGGAAGVEFSYDKDLTGTNGYVLADEDLYGNPLPQTTPVTVPAHPGLTLQLTIDSGLQADLERELEAAVATTGASKAYAIVMQPSTGAILADASWPTFDPESYTDADPATWTNTVQSFRLVPGSVFKTVTASAVLQENLATPGTLFDDPGYLAVSGIHIRDFQQLPAQMTLLQAFEQSSNVVFGHLGLDLGTARFYQYLSAFGLTAKPGSDLPGEQAPILAAQKTLRPVDLASEAFGETLSLTPLSMITAVNVIADGGVLIRPHVGAALLDPDGHVVTRIPVDRERQVLSPAVTQAVRQMMVGVVRDGTGQRGFIPCYDVAGKTGTANIYGGGGVLQQYIASFVAFAPAENPAAIALVMLYNPKGQLNEGGEVAAPVVQQVLSTALHNLGVPPQCTPENSAPPAPGSPGSTPLTLDMVTMPNVVGLTATDAVATARAAGITLHVQGSGSAILRQDPPASAMVQRWTTADAFTDPNALTPPGFVPVPDVSGKTVADAAQALAAAGLTVDATGAGQAVAQSPEAGTAVPPGSSVQVQFAAGPS